MNIHTAPSQAPASTTKHWFNPRNILLAMGIILMIFLAYWGWHSASNTSVRELIIGNLKAKNELASVEVSISATVKESQQNKLFFIPLGSTHVIYEANGKIVAGIDMEGLEVKDVNPVDHSIHIILPPPHLINKFIDINSSNIVDSYTLWYGPNQKAELLDKAQKSALKVILGKACDQEIYAAANNNAQVILTQILSKVGYKNIQIQTQQAIDCDVSTL